MLNIICDDDDSSIESSDSDPEEADNNSLFNECRIRIKNYKAKEPERVSSHLVFRVI
ncbi:unnamed protein product [Meloidogyne enterolobii]|uniref:Uncharacterized protein n=1 Tax=Meloidogyne enterolobii TaxID=390850 RepID=A0ACB0ZEA9_MELEN